MSLRTRKLRSVREVRGHVVRLGIFFQKTLTPRYRAIGSSELTAYRVVITPWQKKRKKFFRQRDISKKHNNSTHGSSAKNHHRSYRAFHRTFYLYERKWYTVPIHT